MSSHWPAPRRSDLVVAGAGVVGLAVALEGVRRGLQVLVVERDAQAGGASVRNFGHGCVTAQTGVALEYALVARRRWLELQRDAGLWLQECGTVVVGRSPEELAVLNEFASMQPELTRLLSREQVLARVPVARAGLLGGAFLPLDVRVDPRQAVGVMARHAAELGVEMCFSTSALSAQTGVLHTSRGDVHAPAIVLAVGHDLDRLEVGAAESAEVGRCSLHMLRVANPTPRTIEPALLTGTSMLRYSGFLACPSSAQLKARLEAERPELMRHGVNHMLTQHPSGDLLIGDTHGYAETPSPFADEALDQLLLDETQQLLGVSSLQVRERWRGTYAWAPGREFALATPRPGVRTVAVTSGIGMTTALGLAPALLDDLLETSRPALTRA